VKVGVLSPGQSRFPPNEVFDRTQQGQGWVLGRMMVIEYRFSSDRADVDAKNAAELVDQQQVDLLVARGAHHRRWRHRTWPSACPSSSLPSTVQSTDPSR